MKNKTNYEVEGCWSVKKIFTRCRLCGEKLRIVPREGHFNSKYWKLERDDDLILVCCPNNCNVKEAETKIHKFLKINKYCTDDSQSWKYQLDYHKILHAWIDRQGVMYPVEQRGHIDFAVEHNTTERKLENNGWIKLTSKEFFWFEKLSNNQIDTIFDYIQSVGSNTDMKTFEKYIDDSNRTFKIKGK